MGRLTETRVAVPHALRSELELRCLRCEHVVVERPRGCKAGHCANCGHPYPLGDCSD
jgi:hypothetical protein